METQNGISKYVKNEAKPENKKLNGEILCDFIVWLIVVLFLRNATTGSISSRWRKIKISSGA